MYNSSILEDVKKVLGVDPSNDVFDLDIALHINSTFATLHQLGVGPEEGFFITGPQTKWSEFTTDPRLSGIKSYLVGKVRLAFDPPQHSYTQEAVKETLKEFEFRLDVASRKDDS